MTTQNHRYLDRDLRTIFCVVVFAFSFSAAAFAQTSEETVTPAPIDPVEIPSSPLLIRDIGGEAVVGPITIVPAVPENVAPSFISLLHFDGEIIDNRAEISAEVHVSLTRDGVWEEVALRLPEARVMGVEYAGDGQHAPVVASDRGEGLAWKFRGLGTHRLFLEIEVPVSKAADGRSVSLTLPKLHRMFASELNLRVPETSIDVRVEGGDLVQASVRNADTEIQVKTPGLNDTTSRSKIRIAWSKSIDVRPGAVASSTTQMTLQVVPDERRLRLVAEQKIVPLDQNLQSLQVSVPSGFDADTDLIKVGGPRFVEHRTSTNADGQQFVIVTLEQKSTIIAETEFTWIFERMLEETDNEVRLDGFTVANAKRQTGSLTILPSNRYRLSVDWSELKGARRTIAELETSSANIAINEHPYVVPIRVRQERPYVTVAPITEITLSSLEAQLRTEFLIGVDRSEVDELTIDWASKSTPTWQNLRILSPDDATLTDDGKRSVISLKRPRNGPFSVIIAGEKPLAGETSSQFSLPRMLAETEKATELRVFATDSVEAQIRAEGESHLLEAPVPVLETEARAASGLRLVTNKLVTGEPATIEIEREIRQSVLSASTSITVRPEKRNVGAPILLSYSQQIDVDVKYGRRSDLLLVLPEALRAGLSTSALADDLRVSIDGQRVSNESVTEAGAGVVRLAFGSPRRKCRVEIEAIPITIASDRTAAIVPIVRLLDANFSSIRCRAPRNEVITLTPSQAVPATAEAIDRTDAKTWIESPVSSPAWSTWVMSEVEPSIDSFGLSLSSSINGSTAVFGIRQAEIQVRRQLDDVAVQANFDVYEIVDGMVIGVPRGADAVRFTWNGAVVRDIETVDGVTNRQQVLSDVPFASEISSREGIRTVGIATGEGVSSGRLSVSYRLPLQNQSILSRDRIALPILPAGGVWLDKPLRIELVVDSDRHLLYSPSGLAKLFRWTRTGFVWSRVSTDQLSFANESASESQRSYLFSTQSIPANVQVVTAQGSLLILAGATTTFMIAFLLYQYQVLRRLPMLLTLGILVAFIGVLNTELLQVLLQPAALGIGLSILAVAIDRMRSSPAPLTPVVTVVADSQLSQLSGEVLPSDLPSSRSGVSETVLGSVSHSVNDS